jgi:hypothetical protein
MARRSRQCGGSAARRAGACPPTASRARAIRAYRSSRSCRSEAAPWARGAVDTRRRRSRREHTSMFHGERRSRRCIAGTPTALWRRAPWQPAGGRRHSRVPGPSRACSPGSSGRRTHAEPGQRTSCVRTPTRANPASRRQQQLRSAPVRREIPVEASASQLKVPRFVAHRLVLTGRRPGAHAHATHPGLRARQYQPAGGRYAGASENSAGRRESFRRAGRKASWRCRPKGGQSWGSVPLLC